KGDLSVVEQEKRVGKENQSSWAKGTGLELGGKRGDLDLEDLQQESCFNPVEMPNLNSIYRGLDKILTTDPVQP
ncbi:hypothetical protein ACLOJK_006834, partial [Asimina triloba]